MGMQDRDWYKESWEKKVDLYGGDFSLNSKPKSTRGFRRKKSTGTRANRAFARNATVQSKPVQKRRVCTCQRCGNKVDIPIPSDSAENIEFTCPFCGNMNTIRRQADSLGSAVGIGLLACAGVAVLMMAATHFGVV